MQTGYRLKRVTEDSSSARASPLLRATVPLRQELLALLVTRPFSLRVDQLW